MKTLRIMASFFIIWTISNSVWAATTTTFLTKSSEWPFLPPTLFLNSGANAVTAGTNLLFWSLGDTITVIVKSEFNNPTTFRVETSTTIQDMLFDESTGTLYVAAGYDEKTQSGGLHIFDLSDSAHPSLIAVFDEAPGNPGSYKKSDTESVTTPHIDARGLGLYDGLIYLADDNYGLRVIDVTSDPAHPEEVPLTTPIMGSEDTLDDRTSGYKQPDINGKFTATGGYVNLSLYPYKDKIYVFVLDFFNGVKVFNVTDPGLIEDPYLKDTRSYFWYGAISLVSDIFVTEVDEGLTAFVTGEYFDTEGSLYAVTRLDVTFDETQPDKNPITNIGRYEGLNDAWSVCTSSNYAYVADGMSGLSVVDIINGVTDPDSPLVLDYPKVGSYSTEVKYSYNVFLDGAILYLATGESGLIRLDVSNPALPARFPANHTLAPSISGDDVCVSGNYTYMLDRSSRKKGLRIFDSSESDYPVLRSFLPYDGSAADLAVSGNYAYIADNGYISIVDVTAPLAPVLTDSTIASSAPRKLFISGNTLYIADDNAGLRLFNINAPLTPVFLGAAATAGKPVSVYVRGNRAYVAEGNSGIEIFDVSDPSAPDLLASAAMTDARDVCVLLDGSSIYALVANGEEGLLILNVTDVENPFPAPVVVDKMDTDTTPTDFTAVSVSVLGDNAFVGMETDGILALSLENPLVPKELDHAITVSESSDIIAQTLNNKPYLTVAEKNAGFRILYLYTSPGPDPPAPLVPTIDAGCFIGSASTPLSVTFFGGDWTESIRKFLSRFIPSCSQNDTSAGIYL